MKLRERISGFLSNESTFGRLMTRVYVLVAGNLFFLAFSVPLSGNWFIVVGIFCTLLLQIAAMEIPLFSQLLQTVSIPLWAIVWLFIIALSILVIMELYKNISSRFGKE